MLSIVIQTSLGSFEQAMLNKINQAMLMKGGLRYICLTELIKYSGYKIVPT